MKPGFNCRSPLSPVSHDHRARVETTNDDAKSSNYRFSWHVNDSHYTALGGCQSGVERAQLKSAVLGHRISKAPSDGRHRLLSWPTRWVRCSLLSETSVYIATAVASFDPPTPYLVLRDTSSYGVLRIHRQGQ